MNEPLIDFKRDRFVVTGGAGFLGSYLCAALAGRGVANDRLFVPRRVEYDLTRASAVQRLYADARPDVVVHLAAEVGGIGINLCNPGRFFYANMAMGLHLIEQARLGGVKKFVQVGTTCAYPKFTPAPFREEDLWSGYPEESNASYGIAKRALLVMCQAYRRQYGLNAIYLLPANLYGPRDNFDPASSHVIPAMIRKFCEARQKGETRIILWGDGTPTREFLYVADAAEGIVQAVKKYNDPEPANLGGGGEISIRDLAALLARLTGYTGRIEWDASRPSGQPRRCLDSSRARHKFGFTAQTDFETGLRTTLEWYKTALPQGPLAEHKNIL